MQIQKWLLLCLFMPVFCLLPACGFHPVYGSRDDDGSPVAKQLNRIAIDNIPERQGQMLRNELIDKMYVKGRPDQPVYHLTVKLRKNEEYVGVGPDAISTRTMLHMYADYNLYDMKDKEILKGTAHSITSFSTLTDEYSNLSAEEDAVGRTINEVSEQIVNRLGLYFAEKPANSSSDSAAPSSSKP